MIRHFFLVVEINYTKSASFPTTLSKTAFNEQRELLVSDKFATYLL